MDYVCADFPIFKVETIGDCFMAVGGIGISNNDIQNLSSAEKILADARNVCDFALCVQEAVKQVKSPLDGSPIQLRIGIK